MCINCLKKNLSSIEEYEKEISDHLTTTNCECCRSYPSFLLSVNNDLKVLCLTKIKRQEQVCHNGIIKLTEFEVMVKQRIKNKLNFCMEQIDEKKDDLHDGNYLNKMNELKDLSDFVGILDEADHR